MQAFNENLLAVSTKNGIKGVQVVINEMFASKANSNV